MKLKWYGHSCFGMTFSNGTTLITDPFDESVGYPLCTARADAALTTHDHFDHNHVQSLAGNPARIATPGAHEVNGIKITGVASFHDDAEGAKRGKNVLFIVEGDGVKIAHLGDLGHLPNAAQAAALSGVDVMLIPIGGTYTITTPQAVEVLAMTKPHTAIAMHFQTRFNPQFPVSDESEFVRLTGARTLDNEIEISPETLAKLPAAAVMRLE